MAAFTYTKPTVGGSEDDWGDTLNANWDALGAFLGGIDSTELGVPAGSILLWSGSVASVPTGWFLCDGANGTPDLRNRFVVGAGSTYAVNDTGGADTVALTTAQMPAHAHTFSGTTSNSGQHTHNTQDYASGTGASRIANLGTNGVIVGGGSPNLSEDGSAHTHTFSGTTASVGSGETHENRPPYLALAYIMKA